MSTEAVQLNTQRIRKFIGQDLSDLITRMREVGTDLADLEAEREYLQEFRKVKLEDLEVEHRQKLNADGVKVTDKKVSALARSDSRYRMHLIKIKDISKKAGAKKAEYYELKNLYDATIEQWRTWRLREQIKKQQRRYELKGRS